MKLDWKTCWLLGLLATGCLPLLSKLGLRDSWYFLIALLSVGVTWLGIWQQRPAPFQPWLKFAIAISAQCLGGLIEANTDASGAFGMQLSPADLCLLTGHLALMSGLWQLACHQQPQFPRHGFFQGWILATSLMLIGWQFLFLPTIVHHGFSLDRPQIFRMLYPSLSFIELGMLLWLWTSSAAYASRAFIQLCLATLFFAIGESIFHGTSNSLAVPHDINLMFWLLGYVSFASVALHPDLAQLGQPRASEDDRHANHILTLLLPLALLFPVALLLRYFQALHPATIGILLGFFIVFIIGWYQLRTTMGNIIEVKQQLQQQNRTDYLTGVPNRNYLEQVVEQSIYASRKPLPHSLNAMLLMDIDGFKAFNNIFGFGLGDLILKAVAKRLYHDSKIHGDHFARVDGDEFILLMLNVPEKAMVEQQAWHIHQLLEQPFVVNGLTAKVSCSIGISTADSFTKHTFANMQRESERALLWAKESQSQVECYQAMRDKTTDKSWVISEFRQAIYHRQIVVYYQAKVHLQTQTVFGVEALVRWQHPVRGLIMPGEFVPHIENTDLIHTLFKLVLNESTRQWQQWHQQQLELTIAVNVSARDLMNFDLVKEMEHALQKHAMPASCIEVEITESSAIADPRRVKKLLSALIALGVKISIDDYGTGYSSLLYLQQLSLHYLKIDQQFIREMHQDACSLAIVRSTLELAKNLNIEVIAEGVHAITVLQQLIGLGCYGAQGFLFSPPVAASDVAATVKRIAASRYELDQAN
ncbi:bifunctional diguanylate cyclase/phosphodiesterase [Methylophilus sp. 5]|uniref:putative bifunctional diguanylate cyclase/phosphodiesterase n=1 Tax=Methylophilus sp. 5 TaxID=1112274 RepID=UPI0004B1BC3D|nr:bifunctional diguanylate cyclase/phosphodiesterase [Methylophilus sp. 5]